MQHDLVGQLWRIGRVTLAPVVTHCVCEDVPCVVEGSAGDGAPNGWVPLQTVLGILIPEVEGAITAGSAEGAVNGVEGDVVDGVDVVDVALAGRGLAVAFEAEVGARVLFLDVLDGTAALDTADGETSGIDETADDPCLPFERGLHGLVELGGVVEIDDVDIAVCRADDQQFIFHVHAVHPFLAFNRSNGGRLPQIPVLDCLVPRPGDEKRGVSCRVRDHIAASNGGIVSRDLHGSSRTSRKIEHPGSFIGTCADNLGSILYKIASLTHWILTPLGGSIPEPSNSSRRELRAQKEPFLHSVPAR